MLHRRLLLYSDAHMNSATVQIRLWGPLRAGGFEVVPVPPAPGPAFDGLLADANWDALIVHRGIRKRCPVYQELLATMRQRQIPVIHDTDDLLVNVHAGHPDYAVYQARTASVLKAWLDADVIVASTQPLAEQLAAFHPSVAVIPNALPAHLWRPPQAPADSPMPDGPTANDRPADAVTVGYIGTDTHRRDLQLVEDALIRLLDRHPGRVRFLSVGVPLGRRLRRHPAATEIRPPRSVARNYAEFVPYATTLALDIGIAPLQDTPFNCCKSDLKFQEYAALGVAGVFADLPPYRDRVRHGENGLLAAEPDSWLVGLERLVCSSEFRRRLAVTAAREITLEMCGSRSRELWEEVLERARQQVRAVPQSAARPLADVLERTLQYQAGLERQLKRTVEYQVGKAFARLFRKLAA